MNNKVLLSRSHTEQPSSWDFNWS